VLGHLADSVEAGPQSVAQILAATPPGTTRGNVESAIKRNFDSGLIERVGAGLYVLGKPNAAESPEPSSPPPSPRDEEAMWFDALERWAVDRSWDVELGPAPDHADNRVPPPIRARFADRLRKRQERRRDRDAAAARQAEADRELREQLIAKCRQGKFDNSTPALVADDLAPIRAMLKLGVSVDCILLGVHWRAQNERLTTWRDERLLRKIGEYFWRFDILPTLLAAPKALAPASSAALPDDVDRGHHDAEDAPPGPHSLVVPSAPEKPADAPPAPGRQASLRSRWGLRVRHPAAGVRLRLKRDR
jgi:hypothetical protein